MLRGLCSSTNLNMKGWPAGEISNARSNILSERPSSERSQCLLSEINERRLLESLDLTFGIGSAAHKSFIFQLMHTLISFDAFDN